MSVLHYIKKKIFTLDLKNIYFLFYFEILCCYWTINHWKTHSEHWRCALALNITKHLVIKMKRPSRGPWTWPLAAPTLFPLSVPSEVLAGKVQSLQRVCDKMRSFGKAQESWRGQALFWHALYQTTDRWGQRELPSAMCTDEIYVL